MKKLIMIWMGCFLILSGCQGDTITFDYEVEADVIIVGAGGGGLSTALEAVKLGAKKVIILEMLGMSGGALNTTVGTLSGAKTKIQTLDGLNGDSYESYAADIIKEGEKEGGKANHVLVDRYVKEAGETIDWLWDAGLSENGYIEDRAGHKAVLAPEHTLYTYPRSYKPKPKNPARYRSAVHELLDELIKEEPKIEIVFYTEATKLIANEDGQVLSVLGTQLGTNKTTLFKAKQAVVMATGGYAANPVLMGEFNEYGSVIITGGLATATGKGIRMIQEVGGYVDPEKMGWIPTYPMGLENIDQPGTGRISPTKTQFAGGILVNTSGKRFVNETDADGVVREIALEKQPSGIQYEVYTDKIANDLITSGQGGLFKAIFQEGNGAPHIVSATSLEGLAEKLDIDVNTFKETVATYNHHVDTKTVDEYGRQFETTSVPYNVAINKIEGPMYYAVAIKPLAVIGMGGIEVNENLQVIDDKGTPIPGLYAVGEVVGGVWGRYISSGTGVMGPIVFGRLAARHFSSNTLATGYKVKANKDILSKDLYKVVSVNTPDIDLKGAKDGTYKSSVMGQGGELVVEVTIKDEKIAEVTVITHRETESIAADALTQMPSRITEKNSVKVDLVSGATYTSLRIIAAVEKCVAQAKQGQ